jgi:hypothetical protein
MEVAEPAWRGSTVFTGLSTGEGLIYAVRDATTRMERIKDGGYEEVVADHGVEDKRRLVVETELASAFKVMERQGNTLSPLLRNAWDRGDLRVSTRNNPLTATGAHISLIGHITLRELLAELPGIAAANGFANRHLWFLVKRSKLLPNPEPFIGPTVNGLGGEIAGALQVAKRIGRMERDPAANEMWVEMYPELEQDDDSLVAAICARAAAHVLRLSMAYALLDTSDLIRPVHLLAAAEVWAYSRASVEYIFAGATGDPVADDIAALLRTRSSMTRTDINNALGGHVRSGRIDAARQSLTKSGAVRVSLDTSLGGRPAERWEWLR